MPVRGAVPRGSKSKLEPDWGCRMANTQTKVADLSPAELEERRTYERERKQRWRAGVKAAKEEAAMGTKAGAADAANDSNVKNEANAGDAVSGAGTTEPADSEAPAVAAVADPEATRAVEADLLTPCADASSLYAWVTTHLGLKMPRTGVCPGHCSPFD